LLDLIDKVYLLALYFCSIREMFNNNIGKERGHCRAPCFNRPLTKIKVQKKKRVTALIISYFLFHYYKDEQKRNQKFISPDLKADSTRHDTTHIIDELHSSDRGACNPIMQIQSRIVLTYKDE
jgi:hypothetical protein